MKIELAMRIDKNNVAERMHNTLMEVLDMKFIQTEDENILEATMPVTNKHVQIMNILHGGATIALAESLAGVGSNAICQPDEQCVGMQVSANHMSGVKMGDTVRAIGSILHKGKTTHVWNVDVVSENTGRLISTVRITNAVVKKR